MVKATLNDTISDYAEDEEDVEFDDDEDLLEDDEWFEQRNENDMCNNQNNNIIHVSLKK